MPAKAPLDENVRFLFSCLLRSDYKTIDFARVAADFSINPAAARMRWCRLKKTVNPDEDPLFFTPESPKKTKWPPKKPRDSKEPKENKEIERETHKEKRAERKAKIRAGQRISEQQTPRQNAIKTEDGDILESPLTPEQTQQDDILRTPQFSFGPFQPIPTTPATLGSVPITPGSTQTTALEIDDETRSRSTCGSTITVKHGADPMTESTNISAFSTSSPASSASSFSPGSSAHTSPSPPAHAVKKPERVSQKWRAVGSYGGRQARGRPRKNVSGVEKDIEV